MSVLLGVWESVRREDASSEAIVLHAVRGVVYTGRDSCGANGACGTVRRDRLYVTVVSWAAGYRPSTLSMRLGELVRVPELHWRRGWQTFARYLPLHGETKD